MLEALGLSFLILLALVVLIGSVILFNEAPGVFMLILMLLLVLTPMIYYGLNQLGLGG